MNSTRVIGESKTLKPKVVKKHTLPFTLSCLPEPLAYLHGRNADN